MSTQLQWWVGNQQPSIEETIEIDGLPVDLTNASVQFKMRAVGSSVLKVDAAVSNVPGVDGVVRYDWATGDVDTAGQYLIWWQVTESTKTQDMAETLIEFRAHVNAAVYVELEQFKSTLEMSGNTFADQDMTLALSAASRAVDYMTGRRFYPDADAAQVRYYTPNSLGGLWIADIITLTSLQTAPGSDGLFTETWAEDVDFLLAPYNAPDEGRPWESISVLAGSSYSLPTSYGRSVKVTGKFGWATAPAEVQQATTILATQLLKRTREAPFAILGGFDGDAIRLGRFDPQIDMLLAPYKRSTRSVSIALS